MAIVIEARFRMGNTLSSLAKLQRAVESANKAVSALNSNLQSVGANAGFAAQQMSRMAATTRATSRTRSSGAGSSGGKPPFAFSNNPQQGMAFYGNAAAQGNPAAGRLFAKYSNMFGAAQRNQSKAQQFMGFGGGNNPMAATLSNVIGRTRFGQSAGKMAGQVLGVDVLSLLSQHGGSSALAGIMGGGAAGGLGGAAALLDPITAGVAAAVAAIGAMVGAVNAASQALEKWSASLIAGGGNASQSRTASALGGALGVNLAGVGQGLSGYAAARLGLNPMTGPFGSIDYNKRGLRAVEDVRGARSFDDARRRAIANGSPELAKVWLYSQKTYELLKNVGGKGSGVPDARIPAEFEASKTAGMVVLERIAVAFGSPILQAVSESIATMANGLSKMDTRPLQSAGLVIARAIGLFSTVAEWILKIALYLNKMVLSIIDLIPQKIREALGYGDGPKDQQRAVERNTDALNDNTNAYREGTFGGAGRAAGATPNQLNPSRQHGTGWQNVAGGGL